MALTDIRHQDRALRHIMHAMTADRLPHAYLFHGPDGVGKETLALGLAQTLLCPTPKVLATASQAGGDDAPAQPLRVGCGICQDCGLVAARTHPDLHLIYRQLSREHPDANVRARKALEIGVDVVRHFLVTPIAMKPARGRIKVFIIREADRLNQPAQNALLKTLEEPPGSALLVLLVTSIDRMLPTTLSRCQTVRFDALPQSFVSEKLSEWRPDLDDAQRQWYAQSSDGSLGGALERVEHGWYELNAEILPHVTKLGDGAGADLSKKWLDDSKTIGAFWRKKDPDITDTEASRRGLRTILQLVATWYADVIRLAEGREGLVVNKAHLVPLRKASRSLTTDAAADAIRRIAQAELHLERNVNVQLCIETLVDDLARIEQGKKALAAI